MTRKKLIKSKSKKPSLNSATKLISFGLLFCAGLIIVGIFWLFLSAKFRKTSDYYPADSFTIPTEVLMEKIATRSAFTVRIPIIMYHYIQYVDGQKDPGRLKLATSPYILEKQVSSLKNAKYEFLMAREVGDILRQNVGIPPKSVVLTFDDGYEDFYFNALPILKKYQAKATLYMIVDFINRPGYLTLKELEAIRDSGLVEIGAHTLNHAYLKTAKTEVAKKEIWESKSKLESLLGTHVPSFAYPYGAFSKETIDLVKEAGFTNAVSVIPGVTQSDDNLFYLYRIRPGYLSGNDPAKSLELYK